MSAILESDFGPFRMLSQILKKEASLVSQSTKEVVQAKKMLLALVAQKKAAALAKSK